MAADIAAAKGNFKQANLETALARLYDPEGLAAMVLHRYPIAPVIQDYKLTIREAIEAHFFGLDHIAVGGLIPVIEGAGRRLASQRGLPAVQVRDVFRALAEDCKTESATKQMGAPDEVASMMDSFSSFATDPFFANSTKNPFDDGTNRHGITHGAYSDADYGSPINFLKTIAAVDFLTFVSSFRANISWMGPGPSRDSMNLAACFRVLRVLQANRVMPLAQPSITSLP